MTHLLLERDFAAPISTADILGQGRMADECLQRYKVAWRATFLAAGGHKSICWFTAPDAESVRIALRQAGTQVDRLWPGSVHETDAPLAPNVLVERSFEQPARFEDVQSLENAAASCLRLHRVDFVRTFFSMDRKRMLCLYAAPDAESVRLAQREAGMPLDAVWAFDAILP